MTDQANTETDASWNMGCGHFDSLNDPTHDCSTWDDEPEETPAPEACEKCGRPEGSFACKIRHLQINTGDAKAANR